MTRGGSSLKSTESLVLNTQRRRICRRSWAKAFGRNIWLELDTISRLPIRSIITCRTGLTNRFFVTYKLTQIVITCAVLIGFAKKTFPPLTFGTQRTRERLPTSRETMKHTGMSTSVFDYAPTPRVSFG